jgi:DNA polymerase (family 10)
VTVAPSNAAIAEILDRHGRLLEIAGESPFRARAFTRAAETIRVFPEHLSILAGEGRLREVPGVGEGLAVIIEQIVQTGHFAAHDELTARFPESMLELMHVPGVGAKTAARLYSELGVADISSLEAAVVAGALRSAKGLGPRAEANIRAGLETVSRRTGRTPLGVALPTARAFLTAYSPARPDDRIALAGSARRWDDTVGDLDFVVATDDAEASAAAVASLPMVSAVERRQATALRVVLAGGLAADLFFTDASHWGTTLVRATGNAAHLDLLGPIPEDATTEEAVYASRELPWIPPELRRGDEEFERWAEIPHLVTVPDINGEFHSHTTWSDGSAPVAEMAAAAALRGYALLGITDHSYGLSVAGGLDVERLAAQRREIAAVDGLDGVTLLAGAEVEVHRDGRLDYDDTTLAGLDVVVASLHTGLRQPRDEITARLLGVLANPNVDIIAHPSGRMIERREGGDFDWPEVFSAAARTGTALEINADPARLDLTAHHARLAAGAGCLITINCDAHHPSGFSLMEYGVAVARKAWLKPEQILNCWSKERVLDWLTKRTHGN